MFVLGVRRLYLLGADFTMSPDTKYHFEQDRAKGSITGNNETYKKMDGWFSELRPHFEKNDFHVFNCNPDSNLKAFKFISFDEAIAEALSHMDGVNIATERTRGLYDTKTEEKKAGVGK